MEILGNQKQWQFLKESVRLGKLSHFYLFSGPEKVGKKTLAWQLVKEIFKDENIQKRPHPDLIWVEPEKKEIKISQIRELILRLNLKPSLAPLKVGIVEKAHLMNEAAQNCFLKTLEEPRGQTLLILITEYPEFLLPTIRSRAEIIKFSPMAKKEIESYLKEKGLGAKEALLISQISQGRAGLAIDFLKEPKKIKEWQELIEKLTWLINANLTSRFQYAKEISQSPKLKEILNLWLSYFRENLLSNLYKNSPDLTKIFSKLKKNLEQIQNVYFLVSTTNINSCLALEVLMMEL